MRVVCGVLIGGVVSEVTDVARTPRVPPRREGGGVGRGVGCWSSDKTLYARELRRDSWVMAVVGRSLAWQVQYGVREVTMLVRTDRVRKITAPKVKQLIMATKVKARKRIGLVLRKRQTVPHGKFGLTSKNCQVSLNSSFTVTSLAIMLPASGLRGTR